MVYNPCGYIFRVVRVRTLLQEVFINEETRRGRMVYNSTIIIIS